MGDQAGFCTSLLTEASERLGGKRKGNIDARTFLLCMAQQKMHLERFSQGAL